MFDNKKVVVLYLKISLSNMAALLAQLCSCFATSLKNNSTVVGPTGRLCCVCKRIDLADTNVEFEILELTDKFAVVYVLPPCPLAS